MSQLRTNLRKRTRYGPLLQCAEFVRRARRAARPTGLHVAVLGPDGSGKSTLCGNLERSLAPLFRGHHRYKFRPDTFGQIRSETAIYTHERPPRNAVISWAKALFYFADCWIGYFTNSLPKKRAGALLLFDRSFDDLMVDQRRYLMQRSRGLVSLLRRILPAADAAFILDGDSLAQNRRKPELSVEELQRQRAAYRRLAANGPRITLISADASADDVARQVTREILLMLAQQDQRRNLPAGRRFLDRLLSGSALVLLTPVLLLLAILIRTNLGTPIIFRQQRPGMHGLPFMMHKFRTMTDARDERGNLLPDAERVTRFGRFLRSSSLDELPELLNVWRGEMSLVGPRPLLMEYLPLYSAEQMRRHDVLPGITGWAQINGRNAASWPRKFELDVWYVDHQSLWLDLKIIALTVLKVVKREGISQPGRFSSDRFRGEQSDRAVERENV
jgi:lipopolysaccharide/colanic/teichoic acid biosynthesis glycosyltransferase